MAFSDECTVVSTPPPPPPSPPSSPPPPSRSQAPPPPPPPLCQAKGVKLTEVENEQSNHAYSVAEVEVEAVAQAAAEVVCLSSLTRYPGKSEEEIAAIKIQTTYRGYLVCYNTI